MTYSSVAILVDGDNISSQMAGQVLRKSDGLGPHQVRRAYCNAQASGSWSSASSFRVVLSGSGKNGSELLLSIQATSFALRDGIQAFAIVTSDRDFSHLAHALREMGRHVFGLGEEKTPKEFRRACSEFVQLKPPVAKVNDAKLDPIDKVVREVLLNHDPSRQGISVVRLNHLVRAEDSSIKISTRVEKTWPRYLLSHPDLYEVIGDSKDRRVRITAEPNGN